MHAKSGSKALLMATSITMIVLSAIGLLLTMSQLMQGTHVMLDAEQVVSVIPGSDASTVFNLGAFELISSVVLFAAMFSTGLLGVFACNRPEKSVACIILAIITMIAWLVLLFANSMLNACLETYYIATDTDTSILVVVIGLILTALYLLGAVLNKRAARTTA